MNATNIEALRTRYRNLRAQALRQLTREQFSSEVGYWVAEISDGEDVTPGMWVEAAHRTLATIPEVLARHARNEALRAQYAAKVSA